MWACNTLLKLQGFTLYPVRIWPLFSQVNDLSEAHAVWTQRRATRGVEKWESCAGVLCMSEASNLTQTMLFHCKTKHLCFPPRWRMSYTTLLKMQLGYWERTNPALADRKVESLNHTLWNRSVGSCFNYSVRTAVDFEIIWMLPHLTFSSTRGLWYYVLCILPMFTNLICICSNMYGLWHTVNAQLQ